VFLASRSVGGSSRSAANLAALTVARRCVPLPPGYPPESVYTAAAGALPNQEGVERACRSFPAVGPGPDGPLPADGPAIVAALLAASVLPPQLGPAFGSGERACCSLLRATIAPWTVRISSSPRVHRGVRWRWPRSTWRIPTWTRRRGGGIQAGVPVARARLYHELPLQLRIGKGPTFGA
jgi:hypothetical protein